MITEALFVMGSFTRPAEIGTEPQSILWFLPLTLAIAIVYKAMKLPTVTWHNFIKEVFVVFGSIAIFIIVTALVLYAFSWLATE